MQVDMSHMICERCGSTFSTKGNLVKHLRREKECLATQKDVSIESLLVKLTTKDRKAKTYNCSYCCKQFNHSSNKSAHMRICKAYQAEKDKDAKIQDLQRQIDELRVQSCHAPQNQTNINTQNNIQTQNNIIINALGKEDIQHLLNHPKFNVFMAQCIRDKVEGVCAYLEKKHLDPKHPENGNIRKLNKKDDFMETYDGRRWRIRFVETVLDEMFRDLQTDFANFIDEHVGTDILKKQWLDNFMTQVGLPLDWDLSNDNYQFNGKMSEEDKKKAKQKIMKMFIEYIHRRTKEMMLAQGNEVDAS